MAETEALRSLIDQPFDVGKSKIVEEIVKTEKAICRRFLAASRVSSGKMCFSAVHDHSLHWWLRLWRSPVRVQCQAVSNAELPLP
jgi:hypothetical protein